MALWYSKDTGISLTTYSDADHAVCQDTRHSTSGSAQFLGDKLVSSSSKKQKSIVISSTEAEYIVLFGCSFLITANVSEIYMHQFWLTINKKDSTAYRFKIDKKRYRIDMEVFREIFQICPKLLNQEFDALPSDEEIVSFIKELEHKGNIKSITGMVVDQMYQPWRTSASIINKCLSGKITGLDKLRLSRAQILWGMFYKRNVDFVELLWEDFTFQIENRDTKKQEKMYYPRFTKAIIHHFITKDKSISMRNKMFMHTAEDDCILGLMRFMWDSPAYKTYLAFATGAISPKKARKFKKLASPSRNRTLVTVEDVSVSKKKTPATTDRSKGIDLLSEAALIEEAQVPTKPKGKSVDTHEGTGLKAGVPDVSTTDSSKSEYESWGDNGDEANIQDDEEVVQHSDDDPQQADDERIDYENQETNDDKEESDNGFLYGDVNIILTDAEQDDEGKEDADMTNDAHVHVEQT
ncbi:retrotransposon protein, putative, unclassified [Tanacetum coccineum]